MENKKQVIIKEILYWKENKLLPDHYCKFLLNLYREGEAEVNETSQKKFIPFKQMFFSMIVSLLVFLTLLMLLFFQTYSLPLQGFILIGISLFFYGLAFWLKKQQNSMFHIALAIASLMLLLCSVWIGVGAQINYTLLLLILVFVLVIWLLMGVIMQSTYMIFIALVGLLISYGRFIHPWIAHYDSVWLQHFLWYPIAAVLIALGLKFVDALLGKSMFFAGILALLAPVAHSFFLSHSSHSLTAILFMLEAVIAGVLLYNTREKWF